MGSLLMQLNTDVLKVPLGFIRVVELPLSIIAFSSLAGFGRHVSYQSTMSSDCKRVWIDFGYPFSLTAAVPTNSCSTTDTSMKALFHESYSGSSQFFVFVGVVTMLYCLAALAVYLLLWHKYERDDRYPIVDTIVTSLLAVFWLFATVFWLFHSFGVGAVTSETAIETALRRTDAACAVEHSCGMRERWGYTGLVISVIAGFGCLVLAMGNVWFVYKETAWFRSRQQARQAAELGAGGPGGPYAQQPPTQSLG